MKCFNKFQTVYDNFVTATISTQNFNDVPAFPVLRLNFHRSIGNQDFSVQYFNIQSFIDTFEKADRTPVEGLFGWFIRTRQKDDGNYLVEVYQRDMINNLGQVVNMGWNFFEFDQLEYKQIINCLRDFQHLIEDGNCDFEIVRSDGAQYGYNVYE